MGVLGQSQVRLLGQPAVARASLCLAIRWDWFCHWQYANRSCIQKGLVSFNTLNQLLLATEAQNRYCAKAHDMMQHHCHSRVSEPDSMETMLSSHRGSRVLRVVGVGLDEYKDEE